MRIRFWGTRGSIATAGPATLRFGGNTSCVELQTRGGTQLVLDCGTGAALLGRHLLMTGRARRGHLLVTHTHWDHIQGFPFFGPFFESDAEWDVYGPRGLGVPLREALAGQMQYTYFPITPDALAAEVRFHDLIEGAFAIADDVRVTTRYLNHPALTLGYRIEADGVCVVYASDHEPHAVGAGAAGYRPGASQEDDRHVAFLADADLVIHDAPYWAEDFPARLGWGHSSVEYAVDASLAAGAIRLALTHHDPDLDDVAVEQRVERARARAAASGAELEVFGAAEGWEREIVPQRRPGRRRAAGAPGASSGLESVAALEPQALQSRSVVMAVPDSQLAGVLADAVRADGWQLLTAPDAASALAQAAGAEAALLLVARRLPDSDGLALCRAARELGSYGRSVPIVLVASTPEEVDREAGQVADVSDWLVAPFKPTYARARIRAWLMRSACHWEKAPLPHDEDRRLAALHDLDLLDTEAEERFDRLTRMAQALFDVPIALVSLVDTDRQWFKSRQGLESQQTPREQAFCAHAILEDRILLVPDALTDDRFADNPLVTGEPRVRFYAGVPLASADGSRVGTLCLIDHRARDLDAAKCALLRDLGQLVERELRAAAPGSA